MNIDLETFPEIKGFPRPDWSKIFSELNKLPEQLVESAWERVSETWFEQNLSALGKGYTRYDSHNFCLISGADKQYSNLLLEYFEYALSQIVRHLSGIASDDGYGKHFALVLTEQDTYYNYISYFYPDEGEFSVSSGIYLNHGYGHFVFPFVDMNIAEATAVHELTHACLSHLPLPVWLNEGIAVAMEDAICGTQHIRIEQQGLTEHKAHWNARTIQEFWNGESYERPDIGNELSYELGHFCVHSLAQNYQDFCQFVNSANFKDAGEAAAKQIYGGSLGGLIEQFFGAGNWSPNPELWRLQSEAGN